MAERVDAVNKPPGRIRYGWPLSKRDWESIPGEVWQSNKWQSHPLGHASRTAIPAVPGVYMMCVRPPRASMMKKPFASLLDVIYVGRTKNLRTRYSKHLNTPSPKVRSARQTYSDSLRFWFLHLPKHRTFEIERLLISCFGPPANDRPGDIPKLTVGPTSQASSTKSKGN